MDKDIKYVWFWLVLGLLAGILSGCDTTLPTTEPVSSCTWSQSDGGASGVEQVTCKTTLDACIVQGDHDCWITGSAEPDELDLYSDGITNGYVRRYANGGSVVGTWQRVDRTVVLSDGNVIELVEAN